MISIKRTPDRALVATMHEKRKSKSFIAALPIALISMIVTGTPSYGFALTSLKCTRTLKITSTGKKNYQDSIYLILSAGDAKAYDYEEDGTQRVWDGSYESDAQKYTVRLETVIPGTGTVHKHSGLVIPHNGLLISRQLEINRLTGRFTMKADLGINGSSTHIGNCRQDKSHLPRI